MECWTLFGTCLMVMEMMAMVLMKWWWIMEIWNDFPFNGNAISMFLKIILIVLCTKVCLVIIQLRGNTKDENVQHIWNISLREMDGDNKFSSSVFFFFVLEIILTPFEIKWDLLVLGKGVWNFKWIRGYVSPSAGVLYWFLIFTIIRIRRTYHSTLLTALEPLRGLHS